MSEYAVPGRFRAHERVLEALTVAVYAILGSLLCWTRLVGLDRSYWHDEIVTVADYVRAGPREILVGPYIPNNHELFSLLAWATTSLVGESEITVRLWSILPFVLGVIVVTAWLHIRVSPLSGVIFLFLATVSPMLLELSRQARGYGLAFLAMSVLIVAALEADRSGRTWPILTFCAAGLIGTWTLPIFGVAFLVTGAVLVTDPNQRRRAAFALAGSTLAIMAWYAPHFDDLLESSKQQSGETIAWFGIVTAPIDWILLPALRSINDSAATGSPASLTLVAAMAFVLISSPLLREKRAAFILGSGVAATLLVVWATRLYLSPRFVSFLVVPLFVLLSTGPAHMLARTGARPLGVRAVVVVTFSAIITAYFVSSAAQILRLPREAHKNAANAIASRVPPPRAIFVYAHQPRDLAFYLDAPVKGLDASDVVSTVCGEPGPVAYVVQPFLLPPVDVPCLRRQGVQRYRFRQYSRGQGINVWFIPS